MGNCCTSEDKVDANYNIRAAAPEPQQSNVQHLPVQGGNVAQPTQSMNPLHNVVKEVHGKLAKKEDTLASKYNHLPSGGPFRYPDGSTYQGEYFLTNYN